MRIAVYLPLLCGLLYAAAGPRLALRHLAPRLGLWTLTLGAVLAAAASTWSLALLAGTLLDDTVPAGLTDVHAPVTDPVAIAASALLLAGLIRLAHTAAARTRLHRQLRRSCASSTSRVVIVADPVPDAFAVPGNGGHIMVSQGMLAALTPAERRVLFAHERAHLRQHHHRHDALVSAAAALNPLLIRVRNASIHLCERCADETAAAQVGDRGLAASALARAALATAATGRRDPAVSMRYHRIGVAARVAALQQHPAAARPGLATLLLAVTLLIITGLAVLADIDATGDFTTLFVRAMPPGG